MIMMLVYVIVQETLQRILNSHTICMYLCHSQMTAMAAMAFFIKVLEWQWHYNPALDSLYLIATSCVRLYIFFQHPFAVLVLSPFFDLEAPFDRILLYMANLTTAPPQPSLPTSLETDPSQARASTSSSSSAFGGSERPPGDPGTASILKIDFLSSKSVQRDYVGPFGRPLVSISLVGWYCVYTVALFWVSYYMTLGYGLSYHFLLFSCVPTYFQQLSLHGHVLSQ